MSNLNKTSKGTSSGMSAFGFLSSVLTIVFVVFKLMGNIDWSWWLVFSPILIYVGLSISIFILIFAVIFIVALFND